VVEPESGGKVAPSLRRSHTPLALPEAPVLIDTRGRFLESGVGRDVAVANPVLVFPPKPTASSRVTVERLETSVVENTATLWSFPMSELSGWSPAAYEPKLYALPVRRRWPLAGITVPFSIVATSTGVALQSAPISNTP
jgi:hypothetical protein